MAFPDKFIQELIDRSDIVEVVGSYVNLARRSGANYFGLCPFHNERTPSFAVNPAGQFYHCFGCGKGGGVINFIMEIENLSYPDAVRHLAARAGMEVPEEDRDSRKRQKLLAVNKDAAKCFYEMLSSPGGEAAVRYMRERGISPGTARRFGLGFAPDRWDTLLQALRAKGHSEQELYEAGLVKRGRGGGFYDVFRNRLMFPVIDVRGEVIGFSGRLLSGEGPKYLNSPETPVFSKSRNLFGMNLAKKSQAPYLMLVEGNIDVVSLHQAGFDSAVASLGTSLTAEQARLMSRYKSEVILAYDSDEAGKKAAARAIGILEKLDLKVRILQMQGAKDPDEYIKARGPDAFRNLLEKSEEQVDYRLGTVRAKHDLTRDEEKVAYLKEATELLATLPGSVERQVYGSRVAEEAGVAQDAVIGEIERRRKAMLSRSRKSEERELQRAEKSFQPEAKSLRYNDPGSAAAEEGIVRLLYLEPALLGPFREELPEEGSFSSPALGKIFSALRRRIDEGQSLSVGALAPELTAEEMDLFVRLLQKPEKLSKGEEILRDYLRRFRELRERKAPEEDLNALSEMLRRKQGLGPDRE